MTKKTPINDHTSEVEQDDLILHEAVEIFIKDTLRNGLSNPAVPRYGLPPWDYLNSYRLLLAIYQRNGLKPFRLNTAQHTTHLRYNGKRVLYPSNMIRKPLCALGLLGFKKDDDGNTVYWPILSKEEMRFGKTP